MATQEIVRDIAYQVKTAPKRFVHVAHDFADGALKTVRENATKIKNAVTLAAVLTAGSLFYAPQQPLPFNVFGVEKAQAGDPNNPGPNYRGYHADIVTFGDGSAILNMVGNIPFGKRFNAFGGYDIVLLEDQSPTQFATAQGEMMEADIVKGDEAVGHAFIYYIYKAYQNPTLQSFAVGRFHR